MNQPRKKQNQWLACYEFGMYIYKKVKIDQIVVEKWSKEDKISRKV